MYGSTSHERRLRMPGDGIVPRPQFVITHAITIEAPAADVWPWLVQMGWHRGGWYTARWVDKLLFPANRASADHIVDELQDLKVGDFIPDGPPETECGFMVEQLASPRLLVCTPRRTCRWNCAAAARHQLTGHGFSTWCQSRMTVGHGSSFAGAQPPAPGGLTMIIWAVILPADFLMSRDMLRGIRRRAERLDRTT
jgi:hypothetical protein